MVKKVIKIIIYSIVIIEAIIIGILFNCYIKKVESQKQCKTIEVKYNDLIKEYNNLEDEYKELENQNYFHKLESDYWYYKYESDVWGYGKE